MNKGKIKLVSICMAAALAVQPVMGVAAAQTTQNKEAAKAKKSQLEDNLNQVNGTIDGLKSEKNDLESHVQELDGQLGELSAKLEELNATLADTETRMKETKKLLKQAKQDESQQYEAMKKRIRYMYENGNYAYAEMIFSSGSIAELLNNAEYVTKISEYDRDMLEKYQGTKDRIAQKNKELKQQYQESQNLRAQVSQQEAEVSGVIQAKKEQIDQYNDQISDQESLAASYASEMEAQNSVLAEIQAQEAAMAAAEEAARQEAAAAEAAAVAAQAEAERKAREAAEAQAAAQASQDAQAQAEAQQKQAEAEAAKQEADWQQQQADNSANTSNGASGGFVWPCPSSYTITSEFGGRESPTAGASSNHMGIDIGAPSGSSIVAAAAGTVVTAQYSTSAGNYVIISHGNGISTVYMHASALYVSPGQTVSAGESIAAVGSTGYSTGPHLHFGVTVNGAYVNPHNYVG